MPSGSEREDQVSVWQRRRRITAAVVDSAAWIVGIVVAVVLRFEFEPTVRGWISMALLAVLAAAGQVVVGYYLALYRGRFTYGSFDEVRALGIAVVVQATVLTVLVMIVGPYIGLPRGTVILAFPFVLLLMFGVRYIARLVLERRRKPGAEAEPALIVGAGYVGDVLLHQMTTDPTSPLRAVGILDDDPAKKNLRLRGVPVIGRTTEIVAAAQDTGATTLVIAIGTADSLLLRRLTDDAEAAGLRVRITPTLTNMMSGAQSAIDLRDISIEDLIGRHPVDTNVELIAGYAQHHHLAVARASLSRLPPPPAPASSAAARTSSSVTVAASRANSRAVNVWRSLLGIICTTYERCSRAIVSTRSDSLSRGSTR